MRASCDNRRSVTSLVTEVAGQQVGVSVSVDASVRAALNDVEAFQRFRP